MKTLRVKTNDGQTQTGWAFDTFTALQIGVEKPRRISGWMLVSPDGVARFCEGNWQKFVPFANLVLGNYDCQPNVS